MNNTADNRAVLYVRVSTDDQHNSVEAQEQRMRAYCKLRGLQVVAVYTDEAVSGGVPLAKRAQGALLVETLRTRQAQHVVGAKIDRLFRHQADAIDTAERWRKAGIGLHIADMGVTIDTSTAAGWVCYSTLSMVAHVERLVTGERNKETSAHLKAQGKAYCGPVYGYRVKGGRIVDGKRHGGELVPDAREQAVLQRMRDMREGGATLVQIADALTADKVRTKCGGKWRASTVTQILRRSEA